MLKGEYVTILDRDLDDGWWRGRNERGEEGVFPANFVKEISDETPPPPPSRTSRISSTSDSVNKSPIVGTARPPLARPPSVPGGSRPSSFASNRSSSIAENAPFASPPPLPSSPSPARVLSFASSTSVPSQDTSSSIGRRVSEDVPSQISLNVAEREEQKPAAIVEDDFSDAVSDVPSSMAVEVSSSVAGETIDETPSGEEETSEDTEKNVTEQPEPQPDVQPEVQPEAHPEPSAEEERESAPATMPDVATTESIAELEPKVDIDQGTKAEHIVSPVEIKEEVNEEVPATIPEATQPTAESDAVEGKKDVNEVVKEDEAMEEVTETTKNDEAVSEEATFVEPEETKPDFSAITSGPKLATPNRARPTRSRRPQETKASEPSQTALLEQEVAKVSTIDGKFSLLCVLTHVSQQEPEEKAPVEEKATAAPPAKPVKPIFQKFPTPFAGADTSTRTLKPVQRRMWEPTEATQESIGEKKTEEKEEPPRGVKNISSRFNFAGVPSGGGNEVLETKLRNHTKNEVEKARKDLERQLNEEREERKRLEEKVADLSAKLEAFMAQAGQQ